MAFPERGGGRGRVLEGGKEKAEGLQTKYQEYLKQFDPDVYLEGHNVPEPNNAGAPLTFEAWVAEERRVAEYTQFVNKGPDGEL